MLGPWSRVGQSERSRALRQIATAIRGGVEELARWDSLETGKPLSSARGSTLACAQYFDYYAGMADKLEGRTIPVSPASLDFTILEPMGVTAHVVPWNVPLSILGRSLAPALAAGNTAVIKASELAPLAVLRMLELVRDADILPPGVINAVTGYGSAGEALVGHPLTDLIVFTGSVATGSKVMAAAAANVTPVVLELGGKAPFIVLEDSDVEAVAPAIAKAAFRNSGQLCTARTRLLLHRSLADSLLPSLTIIIGMTAGTMFAVWLGQLLTEQGIGNGVSLIIFAGILSSVPYQIRLLSQQPVLLIIFILITILTVALIVWVQEGQRRIPVQYGKRVRTMRGNRMMMVGGQSTYIPMRVNTAGMIPLIFAQSLLILPSTLASYFLTAPGFMGSLSNWLYNAMSPTNFFYWLMYFLFTVAFTYFYTDVMFRQQNLPETLQKQGGFIPGIRPGPRTESYLNGVLSRITLVGALFLGFIAILPYIVGVVVDTLFGGAGVLTGYQSLIISSAGLLIVVGVVLDTMKQIEAQLLMRNYEGFIR